MLQRKGDDLEENLKDIIFSGLQDLVDKYYPEDEWELIAPECRYLRNINTGTIVELEPVDEEEHLFI